jgi:spore coat polysaccharide biosynthesis protein SpsF
VKPACRVRLRPAGLTDSVAVWRWRNDPVTRRASLEEGEVPFDEHTRWFTDALGRDDRRLFMVEVPAGEAVGIVRLDGGPPEAVVSINIAPAWRGKGVGTAALRALTHRASALGLARLTASIKRGNERSRVVFATAGFTVEGPGDPLVMARPARARVVATVQARLASSRLPGKVLRVAAGRPLLGWLLERLGGAREVDAIVLATSTADRDDALAAFAADAGVGCFRGSEEDVVQRLLGAADAAAADAVVRITADCPLVDPEVVDRVVRAHRGADRLYEYVSNVFPSTFPHGLDVEVLSRGLLERLDTEITDAFYRDWFSAFIREHPERFDMLNVAAERDLHALRWTVDYPEDLDFVDQVLGRLGATNPRFGMAELVALLEHEPALREVNRRHEDSAIVRGIRSATYHRLVAARAAATPVTTLP